MTFAVPVCFKCRHYQGYQEQSRWYRCAAYPDGIPKDIILARNSHLEPYPGDNGIQFEPKPGYDAQGYRLPPLLSDGTPGAQ